MSPEFFVWTLLLTFRLSADLLAVAYVNENTICELKECLETHFIETDTTRCEQGKWTKQLQCSPKDRTCKALPQVKHGKVKCAEKYKDEASDHFLGGTVCEVTCDSGYFQNHDAAGMYADIHNKKQEMFFQHSTFPCAYLCSF